MDKAINSNIVYLHDLLDEYSTKDMWNYDAAQISVPLELLKITVYMEMPEQSIPEPDAELSFIEGKLLNDYVMPVDKEKKLVRIVGFKKSSSEQEEYRHIFRLFCYLYMRNTNVIWCEEFLWFGLLFPYIYIISHYNTIDINSVFQKLRQQYPALGYMEEWMSKTYPNDKQYFQDAFQCVFKNVQERIGFREQAIEILEEYALGGISYVLHKTGGKTDGKKI